MPNLVLFIAFLLSTILSLGCKDQSTIDEPTKLSGKSILGVLVLNADANFPPVIQIDSANNIVNIYLGENPAISNLSLAFKLSSGAYLNSSPTDFRTPKTLVVTAEDGSTRSYTVIVTQIGLGWQLENILPADLISAYQDFCFDQNNNRLTIKLGCGPDPLTGAFRTVVYLILPGKTLNDNLIGSYQVGALPGSAASVEMNLASGNSSQYYYGPDQGTLTISSYNSVNKLITGSLSNVRFNTLLQPSTEHYYMYGDFYNVPVK